MGFIFFSLGSQRSGVPSLSKLNTYNGLLYEPDRCWDHPRIAMRVWKKIFYYILYIIRINKIMRHDKKKSLVQYFRFIFCYWDSYLYIGIFFYHISLILRIFFYNTRERETKVLGVLCEWPTPCLVLTWHKHTRITGTHILVCLLDFYHVRITTVCSWLPDYVP